MADFYSKNTLRKGQAGRDANHITPSKFQEQDRSAGGMAVPGGLASGVAEVDDQEMSYLRKK